MVLLLLLVSSVSSLCPNATRSMLVPAVVGKGGWRMLMIEVETREGDGNVYASINPRIGLTTQSSEDTAAYVAFERTGMNMEECDVMFRIIDPGRSTFVDGPSAGAAMTIMVIAALENRTIRDDMTVTGTIERDGGVGSVGGLIEKAIASAEQGTAVFVTPRQRAYEKKMLLSAIKENLSIVEAEDIGDAEEIAFSERGSPVESEFEIVFDPLPDGLEENPLYGDEDLLRFKQVAEAIVGQFEKMVEGMEVDGDDEGNGLMEYKEYFEKEVEKQRELIGKGYLYTAANNAFLLSMDVTLLTMPGISSDDLKWEEVRVRGCIDGLPGRNKTYENFEWVIGSDIRRVWAEKKIEEYAGEEYGSGEERYAGMRELLFSKSWCDISGQLPMDGGGEAINESVLKEMAEEKMGEAEEFIGGSSELLADERWHLEAAGRAFNEGKYGACIYDATYAVAMGKASIDTVTKGRDEITVEAENLSKRRLDSLWANVYQGQGRFLYYSGDSLEGGYRILRFANALDEVTNEMKGRIEERDMIVGEAEEKESGEEITGKAETGRVEDYGRMPIIVGLLSRCIILAALFLLSKRG